MDGRKCLRCAFALLGLALLALLLFWLLSPIGMRIRMLGDEIRMLQSWIDSFGAWGPAVFVLFYVVAVVLLVPGSALAISAGLAYGTFGVPLALLSATTGASIAFLISRYLLRDRVRAITDSHALMRAVVAAVTEGGWKMVSLVRLSPVVPFNLQNYVFGITGIPFRQYLPATLIGILPGTMVNVFLAAAGGAIRRSGEGLMLHWSFVACGIAVSLLLGWVIGRRVRRVLLQPGSRMPAMLQPGLVEK